MNEYSCNINTTLHPFYIHNIPPSYAKYGKVKRSYFSKGLDQSRNYGQEWYDLDKEMDEKFDYEDEETEEYKAYSRRLRILKLKSDVGTFSQYFCIEPISLAVRAKKWLSCSPKELFGRLAVLANQRKLKKQELICFIKEYRHGRCWGVKEAKSFGNILQRIKSNGSTNKAQNAIREMHPSFHTPAYWELQCKMEQKYRWIIRVDPYFKRLEKLQWLLEGRVERQKDHKIAYDTGRYPWGNKLEPHFFIGPTRGYKVKKYDPAIHLAHYGENPPEYIRQLTTHSHEFHFEVNAHGCAF